MDDMQKNVCEVLGKKLGVTPTWMGNTCVVEKDGATIKVLEGAEIELKVENQTNAKPILETIRETYREVMKK